MTSIVTGNILIGQSVSVHKSQCVTNLNQIEAFGLRRPTLVTSATAAQRKSDKTLFDSHAMHDAVNRRFDKKRVLRSEAYSGYVERVEVHGHAGGTPAITLYVERGLEHNEQGLILPYGVTLVAIDGETQTEARFLLRERMPETGNNTFAVTVYHGLSLSAAKQILHDYNTYATPITEAAAASFNSAGALSRNVTAALEVSGIDETQVNRFGATGNKSTVVSHKQLLAGAAGYALNGVGLEKSVSAAMLKELNQPTTKAVHTDAAQALVKMISATLIKDSVARTAPAMVWQVGGALCAQGRDAGTLNWDAAMAVYNATKSGGRGGVRVSAKDRIAQIAARM